MEEYKVDETLLNSGVEFLINENNIKNKSYMNTGEGGIDDLEIELNSFDHITTFDEIKEDNVINKNNVPQSLGEATINNIIGNVKSKDGYTKINDMDKVKVNNPLKEILSVRDKKRKKAHMLKKLKELYDSGDIPTLFDSDNTYEDIEDEYISASEDIKSKDFLSFTQNLFLSSIQMFEIVNGIYDPFDLDLDGLSDQVNDNLAEYNPSFIEINAKYKEYKFSPEVQILSKLAFTVAMISYGNRSLNKNEKKKKKSGIFSMFSDYFTPNSKAEDNESLPDKNVTKSNNNNNNNYRNNDTTTYNNNDNDDLMYDLPDYSKNKNKNKNNVEIIDDHKYVIKESLQYRERPDLISARGGNNIEIDKHMVDDLESVVSISSTAKKSKRPYNKKKISEKNTVCLDI